MNNCGITLNIATQKVYYLKLVAIIITSCVHVQSEDKPVTNQVIQAKSITYNSYARFIEDYDNQSRDGRIILFLALFNRPIRDSTLPSIHVLDIDTLAKVQEYAVANLDERLRPCMRFLQYDCCETKLYRGQVMPHLYFILSKSDDFDSLTKCMLELTRR